MNVTAPTPTAPTPTKPALPEVRPPDAAPQSDALAGNLKRLQSTEIEARQRAEIERLQRERELARFD